MSRVCGFYFNFVKFLKKYPLVKLTLCVVAVVSHVKVSVTCQYFIFKLIFIFFIFVQFNQFLLKLSNFIYFQIETKFNFYIDVRTG